MQKLLRIDLLLVQGKPHAQAELGIVFKQRVGPGGAASALVHRVGRGGQVAAVDGRTAGGIGDVEAVAEELGEQLDVRGLAAARAGPGELKERIEKLDVLDLRVGDAAAAHSGQRLEKAPVLRFGLAQRGLHLHVDGLVFGFALTFDGAYLDAEATTGAVLRGHLQRVEFLLHAAPFGFGALEGGGSIGQQRMIVYFGADDGVRANQNALAALDAEFFIPDRDHLGDIALLPLRGAGGEGAAGWQGAYRERISVAHCHGA